MAKKNFVMWKNLPGEKKFWFIVFGILLAVGSFYAYYKFPLSFDNWSWRWN